MAQNQINLFPQMTPMLEKYLWKLKLDKNKSPSTKIEDLIHFTSINFSYKTEIIKGEEEQDKYIFMLIWNTTSVTGSSDISFEEARTNASLELLNIIFGNYGIEPIRIINIEEPPVSNHDIFDSGINYIGKLQELCMKYHLRLPKYNLTVHLEEPWKRRVIFSSICSIFGYSTKGHATSKKLSKQLSAYKMYEIAKELSEEEVLQLTNSNEDNKPAGTTVDLHNIKKFYSSLKNSENPTLNSLLKSQSWNNNMAIDILYKIAEEEQFQINIKTIPNVANNNIMVELSFHSDSVFLGLGDSMNNAKESAAESALHYIIFKIKEIK